ncbi:MAG: PASTA domain-containing protein [Bacteroides sp.]|nr:PASTA domain-containing protein [Eubacterium sp.]MCM1417572.1 PASTA domain-containing protein [Roseburia sp.]MCM1461717.1 PASTA domain-containing protein [Bacteroides sp.]
MDQKRNLCMGCMSRKDYDGPCEVCGYIDNTAYPPRFLAPRTLLTNRYLVGKLLSYNGEGALYLGYDTERDEIVELREYLPETLCARVKNSESVTVNDGCLPLYKSYLSEFADLYKALMNNNESESIRKVYGIFAANNTGYVVMEHLSGKTLAEMIGEGGERRAFAEIRELFPPLLTALNLLHSHGIIHRGLSPESIRVDERGRLKLTAFGISASRTENSSIPCELFAGYAAPEQYEVSERQGTWTDIYGICAVLYRLLTGVVPKEANTRELSDDLEYPHFIDPSIPANVSETIMAGLKLKQDERIRTVNELVARLFEEPKPEEETEEDDGPIVPAVALENRPTYTPPPAKKNAPTRRPSPKKGKKKSEKSNIGSIIGVSVFLAIVVCFVIAIAYFSQESRRLAEFPTETTPTTTAPLTLSVATTTPPATVSASAATTSGSAELILLPDFVNRFYSTLENRYSMLKFNPKYEYNNEYAEGIVFDQDIEPNTKVSGGTEITVKVSKGPESVPLPDYIGKKLEEYTALLSEAGIKYDTAEEETAEVKEGYVARCSKEVGAMIRLSEDEKVVVYAAKKPPETSPPETEPPRTERTTEDEELNPDDIEPEEEE